MISSGLEPEISALQVQKGFAEVIRFSINTVWFFELILRPLKDWLRVLL